jgi:hypothetical protein
MHVPLPRCQGNSGRREPGYGKAARTPLSGFSSACRTSARFFNASDFISEQRRRQLPAEADGLGAGRPGARDALLRAGLRTRRHDSGCFEEQSRLFSPNLRVIDS